ncbi:hypothetical protein [Duganella vulcania]|uniref:Uncharacterized protein n=1 Tax=Duganella vulcania TaxID=2692166 RepID=A0A845GIH4_9BURK|nr:hypothetical protein [Duganella vulcania]MYM92567.1 hypothetical protein [Duganella vulcania]
MEKLNNGQYRTCPTPGPETAVRIVTIKNGRVYLDGAKFDFMVSDFFSVNKLLGPAA